jgi:hypothetical protein
MAPITSPYFKENLLRHTDVRTCLSTSNFVVMSFSSNSNHIKELVHGGTGDKGK